LILSYSAVKDSGSVLPSALTAARIEGRGPKVNNAIRSTTVENSADRTYWRFARCANNASSHDAASAPRSVTCAMTVNGLRFTNRSATASHPICPSLPGRQYYPSIRHLDKGGG